MEFTVKTWQGYTYSLLKPGRAEGSELKLSICDARPLRVADDAPADEYRYWRAVRRASARPKRRVVRRRRVKRLSGKQLSP